MHIPFVVALSGPNECSRATSGRMRASICPVLFMRPPKAMAMMMIEIVFIIDSMPPAVSSESSIS